MSVMFKDEASRARIRAWYDRFLATIPHPTEHRIASTRFGDTHVLVGGPADAPPLILLHGALASSAHVLSELTGLLDHLRVYAVDVIGQSVMSADQRPSPSNDDHGLWLTDVMDALNLPRAHIAAISWGGFVALRLASISPQRIDRLALLVPAGLVNGHLWAGLTKMMLPMALYTWSPTPARRDAFLKNLLSTPDDPLWRDYLSDAFTSYTLNMKVPKLATSAELAALTAPTLIIGADQDVSFPGADLIARARAIIPNLVDHELLTGCKHSPPTTPAFRAHMAQRLTSFFTRERS